MNWNPPQKPAEHSEHRLIAAILEDHFPINSHLPGERELAEQLGVTRPTLREALQRLARDGWLEIRQGKPTRVRDYWQEGNLAVLAAIAQHAENLPPNFVRNLLYVRQIIAPAYTRLAIEKAADQVVELAKSCLSIDDTPLAYAEADWELHRQLTIASGNPIFTLILNGFRQLYPALAQHYFTLPEARAHSKNFYSKLLACARDQQGDEAEVLTRQVMSASITLWRKASQAHKG